VSELSLARQAIWRLHSGDISLIKSDMDLFQFVLDRLDREEERSLQQLARDTGVPYSTLRYIKERKTRSPRFETVRKLADHYEAREATA